METVKISLAPACSISPSEVEKVGQLWPSLYEHQRLGVAFLKKSRKAILADQQGLGKTVQAILAAELPCLVICPTSVKLNWQREIEKWRGGAIELVNGKGCTHQADWWIITYGLLEKRHGNLFCLPYNTLIVDESHAIKNGKAQRTKCVVGGYIEHRKKGTKKYVPSLSKRAESVFLLSGTPVPNRPIELFTQLKAIGHPLSEQWPYYVQRYCAAKLTRWGRNVTGSSHLDELSERLGGWFLRRTKKQVLDLPPMCVQEMALSASASYLHKEQETMGQCQNTGDLLGAISKLRRELALEKVGATIELVQNLIEEPDNKVIVFSYFVDVLTKLKEAFKSECRVIKGDVSVQQRQSAVDSFENDPEHRVMLLQTIAGGVGINLQAANYVVGNDLQWSPSEMEQVQDRAHRIGQTRTVNLYLMTCPESEIEGRMLDYLSSKTEVIRKIHQPIEETAMDMRDFVRWKLSQCGA